MHSSSSAWPRRGFTLLTTAVCLVAMVGVLGLAVDLGRLYVVRNEMQGYVDSAALAAALELDGSSAGITRATSAVAASTNRWNMGTLAFAGAATDFASAASGTWSSSPNPASGVQFVRVQVTTTLPLYFLPAVQTQKTSTIKALAIAGQVAKTYFSEGVFPFSPFAHDPSRADFGYTPGVHYTLRWPANPRVGHNVCPGDDAAPWVAIAEAGGASERGFIEENSSAIIRMAIEQNYQSRPLAVGEAVEMTGGAKQTQRTSLITRVGQDTDPNSATFAAYEAGDAGNSRRLIAVPINNGPPNRVIVGFALFFLLKASDYPGGGNNPFCAEFVGSYVQGSRHKGGGGPGAYSVRLVE